MAQEFWGLLAVLTFRRARGPPLRRLLAEYPRNGVIMTNHDLNTAPMPRCRLGTRRGDRRLESGVLSDATDILAQRVRALGELLWPPEGVVIIERRG